MDENTRYILDRIDNLDDKLSEKIDKLGDGKQDKTYCENNCIPLNKKQIGLFIGAIVTLIVGVVEGLQQVNILK